MITKIGEKVIKSKTEHWPQYNYCTITDANPYTYCRVSTRYEIEFLSEEKYDIEFRTIYTLEEISRPGQE